MRQGKISKLPVAVVEELNQRMDRDEEGPKILEWLNGLPEVREALKSGFDGATINMPNLTAWRQGKFREWQLRREMFIQAEVMAEMGEAVDTPRLAKNLVTVVMSHYAALLRRWDGVPDPRFDRRSRALRKLVRDFAIVQRVVGQQAKGPTDKGKLRAIKIEMRVDESDMQSE